MATGAAGSPSKPRPLHSWASTGSAAADRRASRVFPLLRNPVRSMCGPDSVITKDGPAWRALLAAGAVPAGGAAVGEDLADHVAPGDAGDAAAAVRGRSGLIQAAQRRAQVGIARGRPGVEHLPHRQLTVEDIAADQAVLLLHLMRADHLAVQHRLREARRDLIHPGDHPVRVE